MNSLLTNYSKKFGLIFLLLLGSVIGFFILGVKFPVTAASGEINKRLSAELLVDDTGAMVVNLQTIFFVPEGTSLLREYNLAFSREFENFSVADGDGNTLNYAETNQDLTTLIKISIPDVKLTASDNYVLHISYKIPDASSKLGSIYKVAIPGFASDNTTVEAIVVRYPTTFGQVLYLSESSYSAKRVDEFWEISLSENASNAFLLIGNSQTYILNTGMTVENNTSQLSSINVYIPREVCNQKNIVNYFMPTPTGIRSDEYSNNELSLTISPYSSEEISYNGQVMLTSEPVNCEVQSIAQTISPEILTQLKTLLETGFPGEESVHQFYAALMANSELSATSDTTDAVEPFLNIKAFLNDEKHIFTQREYLEMLLAAYSAFDVPAYISYGFIYPYYVSDPIGSNHTWLTVYIANEPKVVDPVMELQGGISGFEVNLLDRITVYQSQALTDRSYSWSTQAPEFISISYQQFLANTNLSVTLKLPNELQAGLSYTVYATVQNLGNTIVEDVNLVLAPVSGLSFEFPTNEDRITLLYPGQTITIPILIHPNKGLFSVTHDIYLNYSSKATLEQSLKYELTVNQKPINIVIAALITACIGIAGILVFERVVKYFGKKDKPPTGEPFDPLLGFGSK